jgi:uncharacterized membrane protein YidH (DUF202 family)
MISTNNEYAHYVESRFHLLTDRGIVSQAELQHAEVSAAARGIDVERILISEYHIPKRLLLQALADHYQCYSVEYDERLPVPPELLAGLDSERLSMNQWFPIIRDCGTAVIAANDPHDESLRAEVRRFVPAEHYEFRVALGEDLQWFIQDFLHAKPGQLIGTERTGLAFWRNTMAHWRTRMACYRTDLAAARTHLAFLRWGLGIIALSDALLRMQSPGLPALIYWAMITAGFGLALFSLTGYLRIRKSRMSPPRHQTFIEVTAASLQFLENYHFIETPGVTVPVRQTMLARLGDFLADYCTILYPSPSSRERTHLARERNVLAAQRTVAACYRTIYARARTGLAFIRTGVAFSSLALALLKYFAFGPMSIVDSLLFISGMLMISDGLIWYLPVRKEKAEIPRCPVPQEHVHEN